LWPSYQNFRSLLLAEGRLITDEDEKESRRVVILGDAAYKQLYPGQPAVGTTILIKSIPYTVIGVLKKKNQNSNYNGPDNDYLYAPYSAVARDFPPVQKPGIVRGYLDDIVFEVASAEEHDEAVQQVRRALGQVHHFDPTDKDALFIWDTMEGAKLVENIFNVITIFFACVAVVTLCLGGIGVMNIMLVSVTERTREIGIRMAVGAKKRDILWQFLVEAMMLSFMGGLVGIGLGVSGSKLISSLAAWPSLVSWDAVALAFVFSGAVGIFFGFYPARKAAQLDPIQALRYE